MWINLAEEHRPADWKSDINQRTYRRRHQIVKYIRKKNSRLVKKNFSEKEKKIKFEDEEWNHHEFIFYKRNKCRDSDDSARMPDGRSESALYKKARYAFSTLCVCVCIVHIDVAHLRKPRQTTEWFPLKGHKLRLRDTTTKTQGERRRARFM